MCLDNELVHSDPPKHPVSLRVTLLGVALTCATVWTTLWQQGGGTSLPSQLGNQGTASFPLHLVLQRPQEVQPLQQVRGDPHPGVAQAGGGAALCVLPP